jgi:hypothetical protein
VSTRTCTGHGPPRKRSILQFGCTFIQIIPALWIVHIVGSAMRVICSCTLRVKKITLSPAGCIGAVSSSVEQGRPVEPLSKRAVEALPVVCRGATGRVPVK